MSPESVTSGSWSSRILAVELNILAIACLIVWCNLLMLMLPFKGVGLLLISMYRMLVRDVFKWLWIYSVLLAGFSLAATVVMQLSHDRQPDVDTPVTWVGMIQFFIWVSIGEVNPGTLLRDGRNDTLLVVIYLIFIIISTLMLMNLLIGLMSNTFAKELARGRQIWWLEFASLVLRYESRLSENDKVLYRSGMQEKKNPDPAKRSPDRSDVEYFMVKVKSVGDDKIAKGALSRTSECVISRESFI